MFGFLGFLLIIFLLIVFIGFTILGNILRVLFGIGKHPPNQNRTSTHQKQNIYLSGIRENQYSRLGCC